MRSPLISVITAVRNGERYLSETIASIQAQTVTDWEYLIVDDASTDGTADLVRSAMKRDSRLRLLQRADSGGPYAAANQALQASTGRYIMRTDGDDLQPPNRFERQLEFLNGSRYRACIAHWQAWNQTLIPGSVVIIPRPRVFHWSLLLRGASVHSSLAMERAAMLELGGYRELPLSQDYRLLCELSRRGWLGVVPEVLSYVRQHEDRSTNRRGGLQRELALDVAREHWREVTGARLNADDLESLWAVAYSLPSHLRRGLEMLDRWDRCWSRDPLLDEADRAELVKLSALRRRKFLRANLRRDPLRTIWAALQRSLSWEPRDAPAKVGS